MSYERTLRQSISEREMERRRKAVRSVMSKKSLDLLVIQQPLGQYWGGAVRYLSNTVSVLEGTVLLFPIEGEMTLIGHRNPPPPERKALYRIQDWRGVTLNSMFQYVEDGKFTAKVIKEKGARAVGVVGYQLMSAEFYEHLIRSLGPDVRVENVTSDIDAIRMIKSEEEIKLCEQAAAMNDTGLEAAVRACRPGVKEYEVVAEVYRAVWRAGSEGQLITFGSAPAGVPALMNIYDTMSRTIKDGDVCSCMVECSGVGGYYTEVARHICVGKVPKDLEQMHDVAKQMQTECVKMMKPGANPADIHRRVEEIARGEGYLTGMGHGHGQGLDIMEKPVILPDETAKIQAGMNMAIHPGLMHANTYAWICDNYLVTDTGTKRLHKTPQEILVA